MKTYLEYLNESKPKEIELPFRLEELLQLVCSNCMVNETSTLNKKTPIGNYTLCDSFSKFLHRFVDDFRSISLSLRNPNLFSNTEEYNSVDDVHKFVNQVIELIKLLIDHHNTLFPITEKSKVLAYSWENTINCYNNIATTLNSFSSEFFLLVKTTPKTGNCKNMDIFGESLLKVFNGEKLIPIIQYKGTFAKRDPDIIEEL